MSYIVTLILKAAYADLESKYRRHMENCSPTSDVSSTEEQANKTTGKQPVKADGAASKSAASNELPLDKAPQTVRNSFRKLNYAAYMEKRKKINVRFPRQGRITSLLIMASNSKFLDPDLLSKKYRGVAILRVSTAEEAIEMVLLFMELFPRIKLDRIVISLGTNDLDHVIDDEVIVKRLDDLKVTVCASYRDALVSVMGLLPRKDRDVDLVNLNILSKIEDSHLFENIERFHLYDCKHVAKRHVGKLANNLKLHLHGPESKIQTAVSSPFCPPSPAHAPTARRISQEYPRIPRQSYASAVSRERQPIFDAVSRERPPIIDAVARGRPLTIGERDNILNSIFNLLSSCCG